MLIIAFPVCNFMPSRIFPICLYSLTLWPMQHCKGFSLFSLSNGNFPCFVTVKSAHFFYVKTHICSLSFNVGKHRLHPSCIESVCVYVSNTTQSYSKAYVFIRFSLLFWFDSKDTDLSTPQIYGPCGVACTLPFLFALREYHSPTKNWLFRVNATK